MSCGGDFEQMAGDFPALADDGPRRFVKRGAGDGERTRAAGQARRRTVGIAHDDINAVGVDTKLVGDDLLV